MNRPYFMHPSFSLYFLFEMIIYIISNIPTVLIISNAIYHTICFSLAALQRAKPFQNIDQINIGYRM